MAEKNILGILKIVNKNLANSMDGGILMLDTYIFVIFSFLRK